MRILVVVFMLVLQSRAAVAAAWTLDRHQWQFISSIITSDASRSYDARGNASTPALFQRLLSQTDTEFGLTSRVTLLLRTETAYAHTRDGTGPMINVVDSAFEGGGRLLLARGMGLVSDYDVLSLEGSYRSAGAFNFAYSANAQAAGHDWGFRLLYGSGFKFLERDGFVNLEAGYRWVSHPRPDQMPLDLTAGLWLDQRWMVMVQSFNLVSGPATAPYVYFRSHKVEVSGVVKLTRRLSLQAGAFFSPAGQNALEENGLCLSVWTNF